MFPPFMATNKKWFFGVFFFFFFFFFLGGGGGLAWYIIYDFPIVELRVLLRVIIC